MAGRIPDAWLDELRSRLNIVDVVSDYVALKQKGRRFWGLCPFHGEKTPSFSVDAEGQLFYCFGCHKGGSVIQFVMELERMEFMEAVTMLAERAGMEMPERLESGGGQSRALRERLLEANRMAARFYHDTLFTGEGAKALAYLHKRGLDDAGIRRFGLGASPGGRFALGEHLMANGFTFEELKSAGLCGEKEGRRYDMFRERAMFPIINAQGSVLGFGGRIMGDGNPKYLNTSDTPVFNKRQGLYALNMVKKERGLEHLVLVEGYMDVVSLRQQGVKGVVATLGTALTEEQARLAKRYAGEVWVCYDGDSAGRKAILRALDILEGQNVPARVIDLPEGCDPDDFIKTQGIAAFEALKPLSPPAYRMLRAADDLNLSVQDDRTKYAIACCEILRRVESPVELENYLTELSVKTGFAREVLLQQIGTRIGTERKETPPKRLDRKGQRTVSAYEKAEMTLLALLADGLIGAELCPGDQFITPVYASLARRMADGESRAAIMDEIEEEFREQAVQALSQEHAFTRETAAQAAMDCLNTIRRHKLDEEIARLSARLSGETDPEARRSIFRQLTVLTNERSLTGSGRKE